MDPFLKKDWYDLKAPSMFVVRNVGKTLVTRTQGTKVRHTDRDRQTDRQTDRQIDSRAGRQLSRQAMEPAVVQPVSLAGRQANSEAGRQEGSMVLESSGCCVHGDKAGCRKAQGRAASAAVCHVLEC